LRSTCQPDQQGRADQTLTLGLEAMRQCGPLPFVMEEPPRLTLMRKSLLEGLSKEVRVRERQGST
jgi:uncharacterized membrane protein YcjF (UPF0283 family)